MTQKPNLEQSSSGGGLIIALAIAGLLVLILSGADSAIVNALTAYWNSAAQNQQAQANAATNAMASAAQPASTPSGNLSIAPPIPTSAQPGITIPAGAGLSLAGLAQAAGVAPATSSGVAPAAATLNLFNPFLPILTG